MGNVSIYPGNLMGVDDILKVGYNGSIVTSGA